MRRSVAPQGDPRRRRCGGYLRSGVGLQHLDGRTEQGRLGSRLQPVLLRQPSGWYWPSLRLGRLAEDRGREWPRSADWPSASGAVRPQDSRQSPVRRGTIRVDGRRYRGTVGFRRFLARNPAMAHDGGAGVVDGRRPGSPFRPGCPLLVDVLHRRSAVDGQKETLERWCYVRALHLQVSPRLGDPRSVGGSETLENADRRGHGGIGVDRMLLCDRRTGMAASVLEGLANAGILAGVRTDAKSPRHSFLAPLGDSNADCLGNWHRVASLGGVPERYRSWDGRSGGGRMRSAPRTTCLFGRHHTPDSALGPDHPAARDAVVAGCLGHHDALSRAAADDPVAEAFTGAIVCGGIHCNRDLFREGKAARPDGRDRPSPFVVCLPSQNGGWLTDDKKRSSVPPGVCLSEQY